MKTFLLENSAGKRDGMFTMAYLAFCMCMLHALVGGLAGGSKVTLDTPHIKGEFTVPAFSWSSFFGLSPILTAYVVRRHRIGDKSPVTADEPAPTE